MNIVDIIAKKRDGHALNKNEINFFIDGVTKKSIANYQISSLLMAIYLNGMSREEINHLTLAMIKSGDQIDLNDIKGIKVDKHSTGGVGDKTSIVVAPLVASFNIKVAMVSGRGLAHTGGTLDKLEAIPGMNVNLTNQEFKHCLKTTNVAMMGQSDNFTPADKILYSLRDVTATVGSLPLITSSIMSKKIAGGADTILLDVKTGSGAFMKTLDDARELSKLLVSVGKACHKDTRAIITNMNEPLGYAIGNALEIKEAIDTLKFKGPKDFTELCVTIASIMLVQAKITTDINKARTMVINNLKNEKAFNKCKQWIKAQGGNTSYLDRPQQFKVSKCIKKIKAKQSGYIKEIVALDIGEAAMLLGAGRLTLNDKLDLSAGIILNKKVGDKVKSGDTLCAIHTNKTDTKDAIALINRAFKFSKVRVKSPKLVIDYIK